MSSAVAGTVAAALRLVLKNASACSDEETSTGNFASSSYGGSQIGDKTIGRPAILRIIGNVPGMNDSKVKEQVAILKSSGDYRRIVEEEAEKARQHRAELERKAEEARQAAEEAEARRAAAEAARKAAQKAAQEAREEAQKRAAEKAAADAAVAEQRAQERAEVERRASEKAAAAVVIAEKVERKSEAAVEKTDDPKFDKNFDYQGVSKWLHNENQIRAFRKWCTGAGITPYLPVDGQEAVAKSLAVHAAKHGVELSAAFINQKATEMFIGAKAVETRDFTKEEKAKLAAKDLADKARAYQADFSRGCRGMISAGAHLAALSKKWPKNSVFPITAEFRTALRDANTVIAQLLKEIPCE
jgi:multidrug efflux pump subunit AcrA (membrane-fusion protein)